MTVVTLLGTRSFGGTVSVILELLLSQHWGGSKTLTHWGTAPTAQAAAEQSSRIPGAAQSKRGVWAESRRLSGLSAATAGGVAVLANHGAALKEPIFTLLVYL